MLHRKPSRSIALTLAFALIASAFPLLSQEKPENTKDQTSQLGDEKKETLNSPVGKESQNTNPPKLQRIQGTRHPLILQTVGTLPHQPSQIRQVQEPSQHQLKTNPIGKQVLGKGSKRLQMMANTTSNSGSVPKCKGTKPSNWIHPKTQQTSL